MMDAPTISHSEIDEVIIFALEQGRPVYMWLEGRFWIRLESVAEGLSEADRAALINSDVRIFLNDPDAGTYVRLSSFYWQCAPDVQLALERDHQKMLEAITRENGRAK